VYFVTFNDDDNPVLQTAMVNNHQIQEGFFHGENYISSYAINLTEREGIRRLHMTCSELGIDRPRFLRSVPTRLQSDLYS
jgi:hypothetical protein